MRPQRNSFSIRFKSEFVFYCRHFSLPVGFVVVYPPRARFWMQNNLRELFWQKPAPQFSGGANCSEPFEEISGGDQNGQARQLIAPCFRRAEGEARIDQT
jgi:hypothetical protein